MGSRKAGIPLALLLLGLGLMAMGFGARFYHTSRCSISAVTYLPGARNYRLRANSSQTAAACDNTIVIDGTLNEVAWRKSDWHSAFVRVGTGEPAEAGTQAKVLFSQDTLYIAMVCFEPNMHALVATVTERDGRGIASDDCVEIFMDANLDGQSCYHWIVNSLGAIYDVEHRPDVPAGRQAEWNSRARAAALCFEDRWQVEVAIPFEDVGLTSPSGAQSVGLLLARERYAFPQDVAPAAPPAKTAKGKTGRGARPRELTYTRQIAAGTKAGAGFKDPIDGFPRLQFGTAPLEVEVSYEVAVGNCEAEVRVFNNATAVAECSFTFEMPLRADSAVEHKLAVPGGQSRTLAIPYELANGAFSFTLTGRVGDTVFFHDQRNGVTPDVLHVEISDPNVADRSRQKTILAQVCMARATQPRAVLTVEAKDAQGRSLVRERVPLKRDVAGVEFKLNVGSQSPAALHFGVSVPTGTGGEVEVASHVSRL